MNIDTKNKVLNLHLLNYSMKIYTKTGDDGTTGIQGGERVSKSNLRIKAYGMVDELNAAIGLALSKKLDDEIEDLLRNIQNYLFVAGSDLSNPDLSNMKNRITTEMVVNIEKNIDRLENEDELSKHIDRIHHGSGLLEGDARKF